MSFLSATLLAFTLAAVMYGQTPRNGRIEIPRIAVQHASLRPSPTQIKRAVMIQSTRHSSIGPRADARRRLAGPSTYRR